MALPTRRRMSLEWIEKTCSSGSMARGVVRRRIKMPASVAAEGNSIGQQQPVLVAIDVS